VSDIQPIEALSAVVHSARDGVVIFWLTERGVWACLDAHENEQLRAAFEFLLLEFGLSFCVASPYSYTCRNPFAFWVEVLLRGFDGLVKPWRVHYFQLHEKISFLRYSSRKERINVAQYPKGLKA